MFEPPSLLRWIVTPPIVSVQAVSRILRPSSEPELDEDVDEARVRGCDGRNEGRDRLGDRTWTILWLNIGFQEVSLLDALWSLFSGLRCLIKNWPLPAHVAVLIQQLCPRYRKVRFRIFLLAAGRIWGTNAVPSKGLECCIHRNRGDRHAFEFRSLCGGCRRTSVMLWHTDSVAYLTTCPSLELLTCDVRSLTAPNITLHPRTRNLESLSQERRTFA